MRIDEPCFYFVPGGPWINGSYWDIYLNDHFKNHTFSRLTLANHEKDYNPNIRPKIQDNLNIIRLQILNSNSSNNILIGHSYGAWMALLTLDKEMIQKIRKVVLVSMPQKLTREKVVNDFILNLGPQNTESNEEYSSYFRKLLPLYFYNEPNIKKYESIANTSFKVGNESLLMNDELLTKSKHIASEFEDKIFTISSADDLIVGKALNTSTLKKTEILYGTGHFPMLESPEEFTKCLNKVLAQ